MQEEREGKERKKKKDHRLFFLTMMNKRFHLFFFFFGQEIYETNHLRVYYSNQPNISLQGMHHMTLPQVRDRSEAGNSTY